MESQIINEKQLGVEIDRLREQFPHTQELYREVCILLFFRYGIAPTAGKLYQLVRKGSMSAPAKALSQFWVDLRDKSRVRIEHPDLPQALQAATGEFAAAVWAAAQAEAIQNQAAYRSDADDAVAHANAALAAATSERDMAMQDLAKSRGDAAADADKISGLEQKLAVAVATNASLDAQLQQAKVDQADTQKRLDDSRREFGAQMDKLHEAAHQADARFLAAEKRALLEIDRERQTAGRYQKEQEAARAQAEKSAARHRAELESLQSQTGNLRQQLGAMEGKLHETTEAKKEIAEALKTLTSRANELTSHAVTMRAEMHTWRTRAQAAEQELRAKSEKPPVKRAAKNKAVNEN